KKQEIINVVNRVAGAPLKKLRGGFHIRPCPLAARQTSAGAYRIRPYGFRFRPKGENSTFFIIYYLFFVI
ncbi:UNVERIFIED_CONTAM: hypothetical protein NY603_39065, partial [Bacteroidetes bacterium 56_B9]